MLGLRPLLNQEHHKKGDARALSSMHTFRDPTCFGALRGLMLCGDARSLPLQLTLTLSNGPTHTRHSRSVVTATLLQKVLVKIPFGTKLKP